MFETLKVDAGDLRISYRQYGQAGQPCVVLLHGFPYDVHCYASAAALLAESGYRVVVPYLRGFGDTQFLKTETLRSGQQGALGSDLLSLLDALSIERCTLGGFDWGGRAACIVAALWPERVSGLVTCGGYNIQHIAGANQPSDPIYEHQHWYQYYFHSERGIAGLTQNREQLCRLLWSLWSPDWQFDDACFSQSAPALHNADFVDVVIHSYRHRYGLVAGDSKFDEIESQLSSQPVINVPTICMDGANNRVSPLQDSDWLNAQFPGLIDHQIIPEVGHNIPQESPEQFARAVMQLASPH
jgi:pimeloyl-ACP methyl ester carboxylesterase